MLFTVWHYEIDTLPRLVPVPDDGFDIHLPVGVYPVTSGRLNVTFEFSIDDRPVKRVGFNTNNPDGHVQAITDDLIGCLRRQNPADARPYLDMEALLVSKTNFYYEATLLKVPTGSKVRYRAVVYPKAALSVATPWYTIYATAPTFAYDDIRYIGPRQDIVTTTNVIYYRQDANFHYLRFDYVDISGSRPDFRLRLNDQYSFSLSDPSTSDWLPIINPFHDYLVLSVPKALAPRIDSCVWKGTPVDLGGVVNRARARIMFIHYCVQGLNDLFESPNKNYEPYRTYMQTTMHDELSTYSSRPNSVEGNERDGYRFTLDDHRTYQIKYLWTFNGGVLALMAHDCVDDVATIRADVNAGLLDPTIAGFGGQRLPYYQTETNKYSIQYGIDMVSNILGKANEVYYPDARLYKQTANVMKALQQANTIRYIVVDGATGFETHRASAQLNQHSGHVYPDHQYLWQDVQTQLYILYIDDEMRGSMLGATPYEYQHGKLSSGLRQKMLYFASQTANGGIRDKHLLIYSDDADKASGNGWFDGTYSGQEIDYCDMYQSALEWIADHPWIEAVTSAELVPARDNVGTINMLDAIDPSIDPGGDVSVDAYGKAIHFDAWYDNWKRFQAVWVGRSFEEISQGVEYAIIDQPAKYRNQLFELAQMSFAMAIHESQWNKQPVETINGLDPNQRMDVIEPEDFAIAATLQLGNAQVYANAAVWAEWARGHAGAETFCNNGPVIDTIRGLRYAVSGTRSPTFSGTLIDPTGIHWDRDLMENVILYNNSTLVVMDRNGGRITHLFVLKIDQPYCVSGTMKCYQYLTDELVAGENVTCDGEVLQNTVYTPNHAYVACDLKQARAASTLGLKYNPKTGVQQELDCYYPDTFNAYAYRVADQQTVEWTYVQTNQQPPNPMRLSAFRNLLTLDRQEKLAGRGGVVFHSAPGFRKRIHLDARTLLIDYLGTEAGHVSANEFCVDLFSGLMSGTTNQRRQPDNQTLSIQADQQSPTVRVRLRANCKFSDDTLAGAANLRLHRVLTDCIEVESQAAGDFSFEIATA